MDEAKSYVGSNCALPKLSFITATIIVAEGGDLIFDNDTIDITIDGLAIYIDDTSTLTDDEEV